jgi:hypothetical protein
VQSRALASEINFAAAGRFLGLAGRSATIQPTAAIDLPSLLRSTVMRQVSLVEQIRLLVRHTMLEWNIPAAEGLEETILIRNGFYCGRRFATAAAHAIWFCEENQIKFYGEQGTVLHVIRNVDQHVAGLTPQEASLADAA